MTNRPETMPARPDTIDRMAGLDPGTPIYDIRAFRPEFVGGAEACRASVLEPADDLGLVRELRAAVARRVARSSANPAVIAGYLAPVEPSLAELAEGETPTDLRLGAIAAHADMIAADPGRSSARDLQALLDAGLTVPQVIALSELLAFVCFQIRVVHGLSLLKEAE